MSSKKKYNWNEPSLFPDDQQHPANMEFQGYKIITNKNGETQRLAIIRRTKEDFIRKSQAIWGDQYDYSESVYAGSKSPITIRCKKHNHYFTVPFAQNHYMKPHGNVKPTGCDLCSAEALGYYPKNRGPHHIRTKEERRRDEEEKARRREERKQRAEQRKYEHSEEARQKRQQEQQAYIDRWQAKDINEARFKERVFQMYGNDLDTSLVDYQGNDKEVTLICHIHGEFRIRPRTLLVGTSHSNGKKTAPHGCWKCCGLQDPADRFVLTAKDFNQRVQNFYRLKGLTFPLKSKIKPTDKITAVCRKHGEITHDAMWWYHGNGCEYCNGKFYPPDFERLAREAQGADYQYRDPDKVKTTTDSVWVHCGNPDHQWHKMRVSLVLQGCKCRECAERHQPLEQRRENFRQRFFQKFGDNRFIVSFDEYVNNDTPISIHCIEHNYDYKTAPDNLLRKSGGCPFCTASEGEAVIKGWLDNHGIPHEWHAKIPNEDPTLPLQYVEPDFWLEHMNLYIEYHGQQHYEDVKYFYKGKKIRSFAVQQHRDRYLRDYCQRHGHGLLEIPYWDFKRIDEILTDELLNH